MNVATALPRAVRGLSALLAIMAVAAITPPEALTQGVTTGAVRGQVLDQTGRGIAGASVLLTNRESGTRFTGSTNVAGQFFIANVVIGPYRIEARAIGYRPVRRDDIVVRLGDLLDLELRLEGAAVELEAITVAGAGTDSLLARSRTGASTFISEQLIQNLPSLNRNFTDFTRASSLVNGRSIAGQADRYNAIQIDGGANSDLFGLNSSGGSPGGRNQSRALSVEAVQELQVLIAPYDVRQGGFTGGLINAVTRSGSNTLRGSAFGFMQGDALQGNDSLGNPAPEFSRRYYGFSLGGPIARDRFHFFVAAEWRSEEEPFNGAAGGLVRNITEADTINFSPTAGLSARTAERIRQHAITNLSFDPGDWRRPQIPNPDRNIFAKLTGQLGERTQAELAVNNVTSNLAVLVHDPFGANPTRLREGYQFSNSGYDNSSKNTSVRLRVNSQLSNRVTNEFIGSYYTIRDLRDMRNRVTLMIVAADSAGAHFALGGERFSQANSLDQNILEIANNVTINYGRHVLTLGGRLENFDFRNVFFPASLGAWYFPDTTSFFAGTATRYERALPGSFASPNGRTDGPIAEFTFKQFGLYAQDQWNAARGLTLTLGMRLDFTSLPQPTFNPLLDTLHLLLGPRANQAFGVRTDSRPTDALLISPRFGFNYDVNGDQSLLVRGGVGIFSGRTPYVWASNAYTNSGLEQVQLICTGAGVPTFTTNADNQPTACGVGGPPAAPRPAVVYFDKDFKLPQNFRASLGLDRRLRWNMVGSVDLMYTRAVNQFLLQDMNLVEGGYAIGEANRQMYGSHTGTGCVAPCRAVGTPAQRPGFTLPLDVLRQYNSSRDYSYSATFALTKRFSDNVEFAAAYSYARSYDLISPTSDISNSLLNFATLDGTMGNRNLRPSFFDVPHTIRLSGTTVLPYSVRFTLSYTGNSGRPYAYRYNTDVNGDGFSGNDLFYVPLYRSDISLANPAQWDALNAFIEGEACLREQRGRIMERNSCRNPWQSFVDARVSKSFTTYRGQSIELIANLFNAMAFFGLGGENRVTSFNENIPILTRTGYSGALGRGIYTLLLPTREAVQYPASRWKLEFGARYSF
jgi:hypothetical protein